MKNYINLRAYSTYKIILLTIPQGWFEGESNFTSLPRRRTVSQSVRKFSYLRRYSIIGVGGGGEATAFKSHWTKVVCRRRMYPNIVERRCPRLFTIRIYPFGIRANFSRNVTKNILSRVGRGQFRCWRTSRLVSNNFRNCSTNVSWRFW